MLKKPVMLMILDGFGLNYNKEGNAIAAANKPHFDNAYFNYPNTNLKASGISVGLPEGQMGNSEVGHLNIGAGRVVYQDLTRITKSIDNGDFFENLDLNNAINSAKQNNKSLHLLGLVSDGGVHSHIEHLKALLKLAKIKGLKKVYVHAFLDGRDVPPSSAKGYIKELEQYMENLGVGEIATISGRYYAMDRDNRWERVQLAYNAMVLSKGEKSTSSLEAIERSYRNNETDEFVTPTVIIKDGKAISSIEDGDSVIFFNFRPDRARELTRAINDKEFNGFKRSHLKLNYVCMTEYDRTIQGVSIAYKSEVYENVLGSYISKAGKKQLRIAETEKYAHVTFFFNGGVELPNLNEDRVLIPSPKVATYDMKPEMSAFLVCEEVLKRIDSNEYDLIILNFANADMVGHTGVFEAAKKAIESVDVCLGKIMDKILEKDGTLFITSDHGNAEQMIDFSIGGSMTAHTTNTVPFIYVDKDAKDLREEGILADIAPTILDSMNLEIPKEMTGKSLIK